MEIQCECGTFRAELTRFPKNTPGRLKCYCNDCQAFLHHLNRADLLDQNGGTEIIPAYPADIKLRTGKDAIKCTRVWPNGMFRFSTTCCNIPIAKTDPHRAWAGIHRRMYTVKGANKLDKELGPLKCGVMGQHAKGIPPPGTPKKFNFKAMETVMPFIIRGMLSAKSAPSPFFENGEPIVVPTVLTNEERSEASQHG